MADRFSQEVASINHREPACFVFDDLHELARLIEGHVRAIAARFPVERDDLIVFRLGVGQKVLDLVGDRSTTREMIGAPEEPKRLCSCPALLVLGVVNGGAFSSFVNDRDNPTIQHLLEVDAVAMDSRGALISLARNAIHVSLGDEPLSSVDADASIDATGARVHLTFAVAASNDRARQLIITSDVPQRLARGHRELLIVYADDTVAAQKLLDGESDSIVFDLHRTTGDTPGIAWSFLKLGNRHILSGYDHLLFLAGLFLAAVNIRQLITLLTAFTVAHSISLALVVFGGVHLPASIVEPLIAASIVWVGIENLAGAKRRRRCLIVFAFGLIHAGSHLRRVDRAWRQFAPRSPDRQPLPNQMPDRRGRREDTSRPAGFD